MAECYIRTGSIHEGSFLGCGLSHFLEHMLFQGCKGYPGTAVADTLGKAGCSVNAYTSFDRTVYHAKGGAEKLPLYTRLRRALKDGGWLILTDYFSLSEEEERMHRAELERLKNVFSRSGFTDGYYTSNRDGSMFGVRRHEDVTAAAPVLKELAHLYEK